MVTSPTTRDHRPASLSRRQSYASRDGSWFCALSVGLGRDRFSSGALAFLPATRAQSAAHRGRHARPRTRFRSADSFPARISTAAPQSDDRRSRDRAAREQGERRNVGSLHLPTFVECRFVKFPCVISVYRPRLGTVIYSRQQAGGRGAARSLVATLPAFDLGDRSHYLLASSFHRRYDFSRLAARRAPTSRAGSARGEYL